MPQKTKLKGIRTKGQQKEVNVRVHGKLFTKYFPLDTELSIMRRWIEDTKAANGGKIQTSAGFHADVKKYLADVAAMPSIASRTSDMKRWTEVIGEATSRHAIESTFISATLKKWDREGLNPGTIHNRRTALQAFYTHMDPDRVNPVKGAAMYKARKPEKRGRDMKLIDRIIDTMRDTANRPGKPANLAKIRARVIAHTGLPPAILRTLTEDSLIPSPTAAEFVRVNGRDKGEGVEPRTLPLTPQASAAFAAFHNADAYGEFASNCVNESFKVAAAKCGVPRGTIRLYDCRHSFLTDLYLTFGQIDQVGRFAMHAEGSKRTLQYVRAGFDEVDAALIAEVAKRNAARRAAIDSARAQVDASSIEKLDEKVGRTRKSFKRKGSKEAA